MPSVAETFPGYEGSLWMGLLGPANMPRDLVARIHKDVSTALASDEVAKGFTAAGFDIEIKSPEQFGRMLLGEQLQRFFEFAFTDEAPRSNHVRHDIDLQRDIH